MNSKVAGCGGNPDPRIVRTLESTRDTHGSPSGTEHSVVQIRRCHCSTQAYVAMLAGPFVAANFKRITDLEEELQSVRIMLKGALLSLQISREEQKIKITSSRASFRADHRSVKKELRLLKSMHSFPTGWPTVLDAVRLKALPLLPPPFKYPRAEDGASGANEGKLSTLVADHQTAVNQLAGLTPRQRQVLELVLAGRPSKNIAAHLGISQRTVENHRASIMKKTGSKSLPGLTRLALFAAAVEVSETALSTGCACA